MSEHIVVQVTPAGFLALHGPLVASTPALLAWTAAVAASIAPAGRWPIAITGAAAAWLLLALALLPGGAAAAYQPGNGMVSLHPSAVILALMSSLACAWFLRSRSWSPLMWGWWCGVCLLLPLVLVAVFERM